MPGEAEAPPLCWARVIGPSSSPINKDRLTADSVIGPSHSRYRETSCAERIILHPVRTRASAPVTVRSATVAISAHVQSMEQKGGDAVNIREAGPILIEQKIS